MPENGPEAQPSLIQQRHELGRSRIAALIWMIGWGALSVVRIIVLDITDVWDWILLAGTVALALYGVKQWFDYRRKVRAFEDEHGVDAGKQE